MSAKRQQLFAHSYHPKDTLEVPPDDDVPPGRHLTKTFLMQIYENLSLDVCARGKAGAGDD